MQIHGVDCGSFFAQLAFFGGEGVAYKKLDELDFSSFVPLLHLSFEFDLFQISIFDFRIYGGLAVPDSKIPAGFCISQEFPLISSNKNPVSRL